MAGTGSETSIKQIMQGYFAGETTLYQGTVISTNPLKIQVVNDEKLIITESHTYIPHHLTDYEVEVDVEELAVTGAAMTVCNALKVGEVVHVLSFSRGKQFYVLDRV